MCVEPEVAKKITKNPYFGDSRSSVLTLVNNKLVTIAW